MAGAIGSIRRECLDHMIVWSEAHLRRILKEWARRLPQHHRPLLLEAVWPHDDRLHHLFDLKRVFGTEVADIERGRRHPGIKNMPLHVDEPETGGIKAF